MVSSQPNRVCYTGGPAYLELPIFSMCLITFALQQHPEFPLIVAANRDEFFARPTRAAQFWDDEPEGKNTSPFIAGRDLQAGGTWLGLTRNGRLAALTNYREVSPAATQAQPSRGALPLNFLCSDVDSHQYLNTLARRAGDYNGFNLIAGTAAELYYYSNRGSAAPQRLTTGYYGLSNGLLDSPWAKVDSSRTQLQDIVEQDTQRGNSAGAPALAQQLLHMMRDNQLANPQSLPSTGVPTTLEHQLSSRFIEHSELPIYGTRVTSVILIDRQKTAHFFERSFDKKGRVEGDVHEQWPIQKHP